jgi:serine phosphatase RsbU (regulator of sigma subunit)
VSFIFVLGCTRQNQEVVFPTNEIIGSPPSKSFLNLDRSPSEKIRYENGYSDSITISKEIKLNLNLQTELDGKLSETLLDTNNTSACHNPEIIKPISTKISFKLDTIKVKDFHENPLTSPSMGAKNYLNFPSFTEDQPWFTGYYFNMKTDKLNKVYLLGPKMIILENKKYYNVSPSDFNLKNENHYFHDFIDTGKENWILIGSMKEDSLFLLNFNGTVWTKVSFKIEKAKELRLQNRGSKIINIASKLFIEVGNGLALYDKNNITRILNVQISSIASTGSEIWASSIDGLYHIKNSEIKKYAKKSGLLSNMIKHVAVSPNSNAIVIVPYRKGIQILKNNALTNISTEQGLSDSIIKNTFFDKTNRLYINYDRDKGLDVIDNSKKTSLNQQNGLENYITYILSDNNYNMLISGGSNLFITNMHFIKNYPFIIDSCGLIRGFYINDSSTYILTSKKLLAYSNGTIKNVIDFKTAGKYSLFLDSQKRIWFTTVVGAFSKIENNKYYEYLPKNNFKLKRVRCIVEDKNKNIWLGTNKGVLKIKGDSIFKLKSNLLGGEIYDLKFRSDTLWICDKDSGLFALSSTGILTKITKENRVVLIFLDKKNNIWFGTGNNGLFKISGNTLTNYNTNSGLPDNFINSITEDSNGNIYFTSDRSVCKINHNNPNRPLVYTRKIGLNKTQFMLGLNNLKFINNSLWIGGGDFSIINNINDDSLTPNVFLSSILVNQHKINFNVFDSLIEKLSLKFHGTNLCFPYNYPDTIELKYDCNNIELGFSSTKNDEFCEVQYKYILQGNNNEWSSNTNIEKIAYQNLSPGSYTFKLRAKGRNNIWSNELKLHLIIHPPWWQTTLFRVLFIILIVAAIYAIIQLRTASLKKKQRELEGIIVERTKKISDQKHLIEEKHKEITDSINYAERIQKSFLATKELLDDNLKEYFVFFQPKDVVSGDFYWASKLNNGQFALVTADSTGHGVPGAIMSLLNITSLEKAIESLVEPSVILNHTRKTIIERLKKDGSAEGGKDGMDCSLISFDFKNNKLTYSAANNPIWIVREKELLEFDPDKMPVGKHDRDNIPFTQHEIELQKGDVVYAITDGMPDQFGGPNGKKYKYKPLKKLFISVSHLPMQEQKSIISISLNSWKGDLEQVDDVTVVAIKV